MPQSPEGPVEFTNISSKGVTVSWKASSDDGGSTIDHYVIEKKEEGRKNWTSGIIELSNKLNLLLLDSISKNDIKYFKL